MKQAFARSNESLAAIYEFAESVLVAGDVVDAARFPVHLALEELFVNMVKYNPDTKGDIDIEVTVADGKVTVAMTQYGAAEFDVTVPKKVDTDAPLEKRTPGGLGIYLIQNLTDSLDYEHGNGQSRVTFTKESGV